MKVIWETKTNSIQTIIYCYIPLYFRIGRITKDLLSNMCKKVDLLEPVSKFVKEAMIELKDLSSQDKIGNFYTMGIQDFEPDEGKYDLIWCQWCLGQVPDDDLIDFLYKCGEALREKENGMSLIIVKENITYDQNIFDKTDSSVTRTNMAFCQIFHSAGLECVKTSLQQGMPKGLYPVRMYALRPRVD